MQRDYEEKFDIYRFKQELDVLIDDLTDTMKNQLMESDIAIANPIVDMSKEIVDEMKSEVSTIITNVVKIKENVLVNLKNEMDKNEDEKMASISKKQQKISKVNEMRNRFEERLIQLTEEALDNELQNKTPVNQ